MRYNIYGDFLKNILKVLPERLKNEILKLQDLDGITEIRLRNNKRMYIYLRNNRDCN